jgi:hypothetical protein
MKVEEVVDVKDSQIQQLQLELQRAKEEVLCRKQIIEQLTKSMLEHEKESADMANKLSVLKSQMMEADSEVGMSRKYAAVKIGKISDTACLVSFLVAFRFGIKLKFICVDELYPRRGIEGVLLGD